MQKEAKGFYRLQMQSRIPAEVWQGCCEKLGLKPKAAVEVWEHICQPIAEATGTPPDVPLCFAIARNPPSP